MRTLVIHPDDRSTDFLKEIYSHKKRWTVINDFEISEKEFIEALNNHDRIIMMGHGSPWGLLGINIRMAKENITQILKNKTNNVYIWCNANEYVRLFGLKGFATGMVISEWVEARYFRMYPEDREIEESNILFSKAMKKIIDLKDTDEMVIKAKKIYKGKNNRIIDYNKYNFHSFK